MEIEETEEIPNPLAQPHELPQANSNKRVVVITGGSGGVGLATARRFSLYSDIVYNLSRTRQDDNNINWVKTDVTNPEEIKNAFSRIFEKEGQIDVVVNCAGVGFSGSIEGADLEVITNVFNVNMSGTAAVCATAIKYMRDKKNGRIINIASMSGKFPLPFQSFYSASKAAVINFTHALRTEVAPHNIKVTCVLFSEIRTNFTEHRIRNNVDDKAYKYRLAKSVAKYEYAEQLGAEPDWVAQKLFALSKKENPKATEVFGIINKFRLFAKRILSEKTINRRIAKKY